MTLMTLLSTFHEAKNKYILNILFLDIGESRKKRHMRHKRHDYCKYPPTIAKMADTLFTEALVKAGEKQ